MYMLHTLRFVRPRSSVYLVEVYTWHIKITRRIYNGNGSSDSSLIMIVVALMVVGSSCVIVVIIICTSSDSGSDDDNIYRYNYSFDN